MRPIIVTTLLILGITAVGCFETNERTIKTLRQAERVVLSNPDSALIMLDGIDVDELRDKRSLAKFQLLQTITNDKLDLGNDSTDDILAAKEYFVAAHAPDSLLAVSHLYTGKVHENLGQSREALESYLTAKHHVDLTRKNNYWKGRIYYNIAEMYHADYDYPRSAHYIEQAIGFFSQAGDTLNMAHSYNLQGFNYRLSDDYPSALAALGKANDLYVATNDIEGIMSNALIMSGILLDEPGGVYRADSLLKSVHRRFNSGAIPQVHYPMMSRIEAQKGNYGKAVELLKTYTDAADDIPLEDRAALLFTMAEYHHELGEFSPAYDNLLEAMSLNDSISQNNIERTLIEIEKKYDREELERDIAMFRRYNAYRIAIGLLVVVSVISILIYEMRKRKLKNLNLQADLARLQDEMSEFDNIKNTLSNTLNQKDRKEKRLQEVLIAKMNHVKQMTEYLFLYENNHEKFKKKVHSAIVEAERDSYFGELQEIVNDRYFGIVDYLKESHRTLSTDELNLCCLICFGFNNNQVGILFGHTNPNSVFNKRSTLKKKMGFGADDDSLEKYLQRTIAELEAKRG